MVELLRQKLTEHWTYTSYVSFYLLVTGMLAIAGHKLEAIMAIMSRDSLTPGIVHSHCINETKSLL